MPWWGRKADSAEPPAWEAALAKVLEEADPAGEVARYVLTGENSGVLQALSGIGSLGLHAASREALATLYAGFGDVGAAVLRRWGRVLDAGRAGQVWGSVLGDLGGCHWPELMLQQAAAFAPSAPAPLPFSFADLERIAAQDGIPPAAVVRMTFTLAPYSRYQRQSVRDDLLRLPGFAQAVVAHAGVVASVLASGPAEERAAAATLLGKLGEPALSVLAGPLAQAATCSHATVRDAARLVVARLGDAATGPLRELATGGGPQQRGHALEVLAALPGQRDWAVATARADRAASVRALGESWEAAGAAGPDEDLVPELLPLPSWSLSEADAERVAAQVTGALTAGLRDEHASAVARDRSLRARGARTGPPPSAQPPSLPDGAASTLARLLADEDPVRTRDKLAGLPPLLHTTANHVAAVIRTHAYPPATAVQVLAAAGWFEFARRSALADVFGEMHDRAGGPDLLTLQRMLDALGLDGCALVWSAYSPNWGRRLGRDWPEQDVWPFVARNLDWITARDDWQAGDHAVFAAIATLPRLPARLLDRLYGVATGGRKADREPARAALASDPGRTARVAAALSSGKTDVRLSAAQWLTQIADPGALPALRAAWAQESQDVVRGAVLDALVAAGEDASAYLDPAGTAAAAAKSVARGLPPALAWLDWQTLPELTWAASGEAVPLAVLQWLCATAVKARSPEPGALLRHYAGAFEPAGRERLAASLLTAWIRADLRPHTPAEADAKAASDVAMQFAYGPPGYGPYTGMNQQEMTAALTASYLKTPAGSAVASKGLLAVVAACGGSGVVPPAESYLKQWYGQRAAQGKALLAMLAWTDHPDAIQVLLSVAARFRTKSFSDEASKHAQALAERKGWTVEELADRTIPTAGFDDDGALELPYGPRTFTAVLRPDLTVELRDEGGKVIRGLPAPRQADDAEQVTESKRAFSAARTQLKKIAAAQALRLYEAMCTQRSWPAADWERYLLRHPVVGPAVRRLVWVTDGAGAPLVFRPLDDGSLTDAGDDEVRLPAGARVKIAHDSLLTPDQVAQWTAHLADYEVTSLFAQLGRGVHAITPELAGKNKVTDFTGHLIEAFALRGAATRLGYVRGQTEDGGWFYTYLKRFPALGVAAVVSFTGSGLPEENRLVALQELSFERAGPDGQAGTLTLGEVPAVLVSECWQDMAQLAAQGTGYDPDWQKKTEF